MTDYDFFFGFVLVTALIGILVVEGTYQCVPKIRSWVESQLAPEPTIYEQKKKAWRRAGSGSEKSVGQDLPRHASR